MSAPTPPEGERAKLAGEVTEGDKKLAAGFISSRHSEFWSGLPRGYGLEEVKRYIAEKLAAHRAAAVAEAVAERDEMGQKLSHALSEERDTFYFNEKLQDRLSEAESKVAERDWRIAKLDAENDRLCERLDVQNDALNSYRETGRTHSAVFTAHVKRIEQAESKVAALEAENKRLLALVPSSPKKRVEMPEVAALQYEQLLDFINDEPTGTVQSLLYDLDLLPEQLEEGTKEWSRMLNICIHMKTLLVRSAALQPAPKV